MKTTYSKLFFGVLLSFIPLLLTSCGMASSPGSNSSSGTFIDSPVQGVYYLTPTLSGLTDAEGTFHFRPGEIVTFSIGRTLLGTANAAVRVTVMDLVPGATDEKNAVVTNIARLLQTLDNNHGSGDVIVITQAVLSEMANVNLDCRKSPEEFGADVGFRNFLTSIGATLVSTGNAQFHLRKYLFPARVPGTYTGTYSGISDRGTVSLAVSDDGKVSGSYKSSVGGPSGELTGQMSSGREWCLGTVSGAGSNAAFQVNFKLDGTAGGVYSAGDGGDYGSYTLKKL